MTAYEIPYGKPNSPLYIELHKTLFPSDSDAYGEFNRYFEQAWDRAIRISVDGVDILTMEYTDHLFYLICHAFKHFLHSGFGIRQVCDIVLFANAYGEAIDWTRLLKECQEIRADLFSAALFRIGEKYLTFDPEKACYPSIWRQIEVQEDELLNDLLDAGVYGDSSMSRKHSSNMTLQTVAADKSGKKRGNSILTSLFPPVSALESRYFYLQKHPYLLPVAWISRMIKYRKEMKVIQNNDAASSLEIGHQRIELLKKYGIIKENDNRVGGSD